MEERQAIIEAIVEFAKTYVGWHGTTAQLASRLKAQNTEVKDIIRSAHQISSLLRHNKDALFIRDVHFSHIRTGDGGKCCTMLWYGAHGKQIAMNLRWDTLRKAGRPKRTDTQRVSEIEQ